MTTFRLDRSGLLVPGTAVRELPPPEVVYIKPYFNRQGPSLACWAQRGLIVFRDQQSGAERRIPLIPFRQRLRALEQILEKMYRQDYPYPDYRQQLATLCEGLRRVLRLAEQHGDLETPGAPEYHRDHGPHQFYLPQGLEGLEKSSPTQAAEVPPCPPISPPKNSD